MSVPKKLQIKLSDRHQELLGDIMDTLQITQREAVYRAIEGLHKIAIMQRKKEKENRAP